MESSSSIESMESFQTDDAWLPKVPKVLRVDKKAIFALAAEEFNLTVHEELTEPVDEDNFITKITINNIMARKSSKNEPKEFIGDIAETKKQSIQNAYQAALAFLEKEHMVIIDDYNAPRVSQLKKDVLYHSSWHMLFEDKVARLKTSIKTTNKALQNILGSFDAACSNALSDGHEPGQSASKKRRFRAAATTSTNTHSSILSHLRAQILSLLGDDISSEEPVDTASM